MANKDDKVDRNPKVNIVETAFEFSLFEQVAFLFAALLGLSHLTGLSWILFCSITGPFTLCPYKLCRIKEQKFHSFLICFNCHLSL